MRDPQAQQLGLGPGALSPFELGAQFPVCFTVSAAGNVSRDAGPCRLGSTSVYSVDVIFGP